MDTRAGAEVADACLDFLTIEMVNWATNTSSSNEAVYSRLEGLGFDVGVRLAERATRDRPRLQDNLEAFKFLCKDFWTEVFKKQVDNLKTNHRGVYVIMDNRFRWLSRFAGALSPGAQNARDIAHIHLAFPCGLVRGALHCLGLESQVTAEWVNHPAVTFTIRLIHPT
mmetsp:Transcript_3455/g.5240  ORF Transcript_3455/g.5240 Transcript_3455/m.5240 type:complete len:168 (-) Transcript_3455:202-705(-)